MARAGDERHATRRTRVSGQERSPHPANRQSDQAQRDTSLGLKSDLDGEIVATFLTARLGTPVADLPPITAGEISRVYTVTHDGHPLIVRFAAEPGGFLRDRHAADLLAPHGLPVPRVLDTGHLGPLSLALSERAPAVTLPGLSPAQPVRRWVTRCRTWRNGCSATRIAMAWTPCASSPRRGTT